MKKLLIVDSNSILNRAYYGIRPLTTKDGLYTNAVYGYINILKKHLDNLNPDYLACAFDLRAPTFRHKMYDGYKANRKGMPEELAVQLPWAHKAAEAMGFKVVELEGFEADDVLGTLAYMGDCDGDIHTYLLTGDRDSLQLISDNTTVILVKTKEDIMYTPDKFKEEYGIDPTSFVDVKALMGDSSDNIPGVPGIGEKTALKLIQECGSLDALYEDENLGGAGKSAKEKLINGKDSAYLSFELAKITREAPVCVSLDDLKTNGPDKSKLIELFTRLEFSAFLKKFDISVEDQSVKSVEIPEIKLLNSLPERYAVQFNGDKLFVADDNYIFEIPEKKIEEVFKKPVICHDYKKLCRDLKKYDILPKCAFDTLSASYLISPGESSYPVSKMVLRYLGEQIEDNADSLSWFVYRLYQELENRLQETNMLNLLNTIEIPLSPVLYLMEEEGFQIDGQGIHEYISQLVEEQKNLAERIYFAAGKEFNINSPKQLGEVLFEDMCIPVVKKTKNGYSTDADTLKELRYNYPIVDDILDYRQVTKLIGTYGDSLVALADENGIIHTTFNQTGTATGRLSSNEPNMQNIPVRGQLGRELRKYFTTKDKNHILIDADYSQIELRLLAEISGDENMREAFLSGVDIHTKTASQVFNVPVENVTKDLRSKAKAVNFGIVYGIGAFSLSQDIKVSRKAAQEYINSYLAAFPDVDRYLKNVISEAKKNGFTITKYNRRRPIPELSAQNANLRAFGERVAMNSPIQGTAADVIKLAMINVSKAFKKEGLDAKLILQVHDELIVEASLDDADKAEEILVYEMEHVADTIVPLSVEVSRGSNWYEAK